MHDVMDSTPQVLLTLGLSPYCIPVTEVFLQYVADSSQGPVQVRLASSGVVGVETAVDTLLQNAGFRVFSGQNVYWATGYIDAQGLKRDPRSYQYPAQMSEQYVERDRRHVGLLIDFFHRFPELMAPWLEWWNERSEKPPVTYSRRGVPDLVAWNPKKTCWFWAEVKSMRDKLSNQQFAFFRSFQQRAGAGVWLIRVLPSNYDELRAFRLRRATLRMAVRDLKKLQGMKPETLRAGLDDAPNLTVYATTAMGPGVNPNALIFYLRKTSVAHLDYLPQAIDTEYVSIEDYVETLESAWNAK